MNKQMNSAEQKQIDELNAKIQALNQNLKQILHKRAKIESEKFKMEYQLQNNMKKWKEELMSDINDNRAQEKTTKIDLYKTS